MSGGGHGGGRKGKKKHGGHDEEHENHERWLVSYADMMTLLMVLFIVMFAISAVDAKKFAELKTGLAVGFGAESVAFQEAGEQIQEAHQSSPFNNAAEVGPKNSEISDEQLAKAVADADRAKQSEMAQHADKEAENLEAIKQKILDALAAKGFADSVKFSVDERGLVVTIVTSSIVFGGDRAELLSGGRQILDAAGPTLAALPNHIEVDGHTNQLPINPANYPSGWELSSARASSVVRYLHDRYAIAENRLMATGFADTKPLYPVSDPRSTTMNRRVEVVVLSTLPAAERALLPGAAAGVESAGAAATGSEHHD